MASRIACLKKEAWAVPLPQPWERHGRSDTLINIHQAQDLRVWTRKFGVTVDTLKAAISAVGANADAVQRYLQDAERDDGLTH